MALIKFGAGVVQMSGSIGGTTFARNKYGNYARAKTTPINPNTGRQQTIRAIMAQLAYDWANTLTSAQRAAWDLYGQSVAVLNRLGETVYLTGQNHYIRSNSVLLQSGLSTVAAGPTTFELPEQDPTFAVTASESGGTYSVTFDNTMDWASESGAYLITWQGQPQNAQRNFFAGPYRLMDNIAGAGTPPTSPDSQTAVFTVTEGQRLWVAARIVRADGRLSEIFRADCFCSS